MTNPNRRAVMAGLAAVPVAAILPVPLAAALPVPAAPLDFSRLGWFPPSTRALFMALHETSPDEARALWPHVEALNAALDSFFANPKNGPLRVDAEPHGRLATFLKDAHAFRCQDARRAITDAHATTFRDACLAVFRRVTGADWIDGEPT